MKINFKKAIIWGFVAFIINSIIGNLLYMNPLVMGINAKFEGHPTIKPFDFVGGMGNWLALTFLFGILLIAFWVFLYIKLYKAIPGEGWKKGLIFGFTVGLIKAVPEAFNQWMLFVYPGELILVQLVNTLIGLTVFGVLLGFFYKKFNVVDCEK